MVILPWSPVWKTGQVGRRLRELGQHLAELSQRVREAVIQAVRETIAQLARDAVDSLLHRHQFGSAEMSLPDDPEGTYDPWDDVDPYSVRPFRESVRAFSRPTSQAPTPPSGRSVVALALAAAGWWLRQRGSWLGALAVGLIAGFVACVAQRLADDGLLVVQAVHELLAYRHAASGLAALEPMPVSEFHS
jgi:hypothetical protein